LPEWFSIEVLDAGGSARAWADAYVDWLVYAAQHEQATDWDVHEHAWGVLFEVELPDEFAWERFRDLPVVRAALDAVPDPVNGLLVHRGRGGSSGARRPLRPRPFCGAGAVELPEPDWLSFELDDRPVVPTTI
jgi:hypothetical protein